MIHRQGFTLIEVLVGIIIISIISVACFTTVSLLTRSTETSRDTIIAINLMQKSMEEVRRIAQSNFDDLETCSFPVAGPTGDACGFADIQTDFPQYTRTLSVTNEFAASKELKRVMITVNWSDLGKARELKSMVLLSRPPDPLPGNIWGTVYREGDSTSLVDNAEITIKFSSGPDEEKAYSTAALNADGNNYDFKEPISGQYDLKAGNWSMQVKKKGYEDYTHPNLIYVSPGGPSVRVDIPLKSLPEPATIRYQLVDRLTNVNLGSYNYYSWVRLRKGNTLYAGIRNDPQDVFTVNFPAPTDPSFEDPMCFTLYTEDAYRTLRAYQVGALGPPSCSYQYNAEGWSSAYVQADNSLMCGYPYYGVEANDRICVSPGDDVSVTVPLDAIPMVTVTGKVSGLAPGAAGRIYVYWPRREGNPYYAWIATDTSGNFSVQVPAAQVLWGNSNPAQDYMLLRPWGPVPYKGCCESDATSNRYGNYIEVGPLFAGDPSRDIGILALPVYPDSLCGNVKGQIRDAQTSASINAATITLRGVNTNTTLGQYLYSCPIAGYRLPQGNNQIFVVTHPNYYNFQSNGNVQYAARPGAGIVPNTLTQYDAFLWPEGKGTVNVRVVDASTTGPLEKVVVNLVQYNGVSRTGTTDVNGLVTFNNVLETWPPIALPPANPNFNYTIRTHTVSAVSIISGNYILPVSETVSGLNAGETVDITLSILPEGAM